MRFASALALVATAAIPSVFAENITVTVGDGGPNFNPSTVTAKVGDIILFKFVAGNHSVTQAPFAQPCTQAWLDDEQGPGLDTGFVAPNGTNTTVVQVSIDSVQPVWLFCQQGNHCNNGMVMVINPPADGSKTLEQFKSSAVTAPKPGYGHFANFSATATSKGNSTSTSPTTSPASSTKKSDAQSLTAFSGGLAAAALLISGLVL